MPLMPLICLRSDLIASLNPSSRVQDDGSYDKTYYPLYDKLLPSMFPPCKSTSYFDFILPYPSRVCKVANILRHEILFTLCLLCNCSINLMSLRFFYTM